MKLSVIGFSIAVVSAGGATAYNSERFNQNTSTQQEQHRSTESSDRGMGSCCFTDDGTCEDDLDEMDCNSQGGTYMWEPCEAGFCNPACPDAGIFANVAQPLEFTCGDLSQYFPSGGGAQLEMLYMDLNGDGAPEQVIGESWAYGMGGGMSDSSASRLFSKGETIGTFGLTTLLDVHPDNLNYIDISFGDQWDISSYGYLEVTGDGLVDAILKVNNYPEPSQFYYVENISFKEGVACASDSNSDGVVDVTDLLAVVSEWGACP